MISDSYVEQALKAKPTGSYYGKMLLGVFLILLGAVLVLFTGAIGLLVFIVGIVLCVYFREERNLEYEYILTNGSVQIAAIYNANRRKELLDFELDQVTMIVPKGSKRLETQHFAKKRDFSSRRGQGQVISMVVERNNRQELISMEPNEKTMAHIKTYARNKIYDLA
jgi:hypothetical protein